MNHDGRTSVENFKTFALWKFFNWIKFVYLIFLISLFWTTSFYSINGKDVKDGVFVLQTIRKNCWTSWGSSLGATGMIKGAQVGTQTDVKGRFTFPDLGIRTVLVISYVGYKKGS